MNKVKLQPVRYISECSSLMQDHQTSIMCHNYCLLLGIGNLPTMHDVAHTDDDNDETLLLKL